METSNQKKYSNQSSIKIKFILILILSNACMFLLISTNDIETYESLKSYERIDYIKVKIKAELMTEFIQNEPVKIANKTRSLIINNVYILSRVSSDQSSAINFKNESALTSYIVYLHKSHSHKLLSTNQFRIYPYNFNLSKQVTRRKNEIVF
jgi:hypothetical protein